MKLPNFVLAGFPKCGSTSLYFYLKEHPEIYLPKQKELHFFTYPIIKHKNKGKGDKHVHEFHIKHKKQYTSFYNDITDEKMIGDLSPSYGNYNESILKVKEILGEECKVIVMLRDPIDRAYANYLHLVRERREVESFYNALKMEQCRKEKQYSDFWYYKFNSSYAAKLSRIQQNFSNVHVIIFEEFIANPKAELKKVYSYLNVDNSFTPKNMGVKFNEGGVYQRNMVTNFIFGQHAVKTMFKKVIPINKGLKKTKLKIISKFRKKTPIIEEKTIMYLKDYFREDVKELKENHNLDVSRWRNYE